jgi:protein-S-isoprenylcysteine O-methyltransferase Ste14
MNPKSAFVGWSNRRYEQTCAHTRLTMPDELSFKSPALKTSLLVQVGRKVFAHRLLVGLGVAVIGLEVVTPMHPFEKEHRVGQSLALLLVVAGLALRAWGSGSAGAHTRSESLEAPRLSSGGPFAYVRNPIYLGSILLGFGMAGFIGDPIAFVLTAAAFTALYFLIVPAEEEYLSRKFGAEYRRYCEAVPRLIPRLRPWPERTERAFHWQAVRGEFSIAFLLVAIYGALLLEEWMG